jgi:hypothetical protein
MAFWETLNKAALVAQKGGLHRDHTTLMPEMHGLEQEMRRRVFCNLYIWDRYEILLLLTIFHCPDGIVPQYALTATRSHSISPCYTGSK